MTRALSSLNAFVIGIDISHYLMGLEKSPEKCSYPAADFEMLSKYVQKKLNCEEYVVPFLVGYSSDATLVYAVLVQAPATTFQCAIGLGFCPDLPLSKPMCRGSGLEWKTDPKGKGYTFLPAPNLQPDWIVFQGNIDEVCSLSQAKNFVKQIKKAEIIPLPKVGHGFSVQKNWLPQFKETFQKITAPVSPNPSTLEADTLKDLPLIEVSADNSRSNLLAVHITGDGGWGVRDEFHLTDWVSGSHSNHELAVRPEIEKLKDMKILCFYGQDGQDVLCSELPPELVTAISLKGGRRIGGDFDPIVQKILKVMATL
jgi:type IV secretory pathway VirJ component